MRIFIAALTILMSFTVLADIGIEYPSGFGKPYLVYSKDPFDGSKDYKYMGISNSVYVKCNVIELQGRTGYFDEFSFAAKIKIRVDGSDYDFSGTYSTKGINDDRYYIVSRSSNPENFNALINAMKAGESAIFGGKWSSDWEHKKINLSGFTKAYNILSCK